MCFYVSRSRYLCKEIKTLLRVEKEKPVTVSHDSFSAITSRPYKSYSLKEAEGRSELAHRFVQKQQHRLIKSVHLLKPCWHFLVSKLMMSDFVCVGY